MKGFNKWITSVCNALDSIGGLVLAAIMALITANVLLRMTGNPIGGTVEWVQFLLSASVGLTIALCGLKGDHIAVNILVDRLPPKARRVMDVLVNVVVLVFAVLVAWVQFENARSMIRSGQVGMVTRVPFYPFVFVIAFGFLLYAFVALNNILQILNNSNENEGGSRG